MHASLVRRQLGGLVPPKIATPKSVAGGSGAGLSPLVNFYSKLPKGSSTASTSGGLKGRYFAGSNASGLPLVALIVGIFGLGYTIDYNSEPSFLSLRSSLHPHFLTSLTNALLTNSFSFRCSPYLNSPGPLTSSFLFRAPYWTSFATIVGYHISGLGLQCT
ncbi:ATP synthase f chain, mitochondrial precursor [Stygiomarasmius scandens]|uniref:ATP synthase f chain, mitochondrial n=1 Tax=Marasmiellus scandens TaxID=2682957 RepID=A0ABR1ISQ4_9AGAR